MLANKLLSACGGGEDTLYADDVFSTYLYTGNGSTQTINNGIDLAGKGGLVWIKERTSAQNHNLWDSQRWLGSYLKSNTTDATSTLSGMSFTTTGLSITGAGAVWNSSGLSYVSWTFRKAPKFFDVVTYAGNDGAGRAIPHSLGVKPGMMIVKATNTTKDWHVWHRSLSSETTSYLMLNSTAAVDSYNLWNTAPDSTNFYLANTSNCNGVGISYVAYLFATKAGISKIGSYTGNGTSQTINCDFTTGARFVMIKRTDSAGDWYVWDTARGIVAAKDPRLSLNTTTAEVTTDDSVDADTSGFIVNQVVATNINVNAATYIFLAIS